MASPPASSSPEISSVSGSYDSLYFQYQHHPFQTPPELQGQSPLHPLVIAGAGPVGLTLALDLARRGLPVVLLEDDDAVNRGSRAVGVARRTLEIFERTGAGSRFFETGISWSGGQSYYRDKLVLDFKIAQVQTLKHPPMISIAQCHVEQYLYDALTQYPNAHIRWSSSALSTRQEGDTVITTVETPEGRYDMRSQWLVACDGGRSAIRKSLGLELQGSSYEGRYLIVDIQMKSTTPPGRRVWFDPDAFPGATIIMHKQPFDIWRIDYQLRPQDDLEQEMQPERVHQRVGAFLRSIGETADWAIDWISPYRAHSLTLDNYRQDRVLFAGDSAHLVPIFGARGMNGGVDDAHNLGWKLAYVMAGWCDEGLLDSYSSERVDAAHQNLSFARKSTQFMTPPTSGHALMREAVLSLAVKEPFIRELINPRQVTELRLAASPLRFMEKGTDTFRNGPLPGAVCPNLPWTKDGTQDFLHDRLGRDFTLLWFQQADQDPDPRLHELTTLHAHHGHSFKFDVIALSSPHLHEAFDAQEGTCYLIRPDGHIAGRWRNAQPSTLYQQLCLAIQCKTETQPC